MIALAFCLGVLVLFSILYFFLFGHFWSPSLLVLLWWTSWFLVAVNSNIGFPKASDALFTSFYIFAVSFALGSISPFFLGLSLRVPNNNSLYAFNKYFTRIWAVFSLPVLVYFWKRSSLVLTSDSFLAGRNTLIDFEGSSHPVFGSSFIRNCIEVLMAGPLLYFSLFSFIYLLRDGRFFLFCVSCLGIYLYQSTELGRSQIYRTFLILVFTFFSLWIYKVFVISYRKVFLGLFTFFLVFCYIYHSTLVRFENNPLASWHDIKTEFLSYHSVGFILLDKALNDSNSPLQNEMGYGRASLSGFWFPVTQVIRIFDESYKPFLDQWYPYTAISHDLGVRNESGKEFLFNAYYTMLFPFFLDFRYFGICIFSLSLGYITSTCFLNWRKTYFDFWFASSALLFAFCIMNIFQPLTQRVYFFSSVLILFLILFYLKKAK